MRNLTPGRHGWLDRPGEWASVMRPDVLVDGVIQVISMSWLWSWLWFMSIVDCCLNCLRRLLVNLRRCLYSVNVVVDVVVDDVV